jgi:hypothetical protein
MPKGLNLIGQKFGRLTVTEFAYSKINRYWKCVCDCGNTVIVNGQSLRSGKTRSCGCISNKYGNLRVAHFHEYGIWSTMLRRCQKPVGKARFGKNWYDGIIVCERWHSFENFLEDMGPRPGSNYSIDRIDPTGNYEPGNCRWATRSEQARNKRNNRLITYNGRTQCLKDWSDELSIPQSTILKRLGKGYSIDKVLSSERHNIRLLTFNGETKLITEWAEEIGIPLQNLQWRLKRGWSVEKALTQPLRGQA